MSYQIKKSDGSVLTTLGDGLLDTQSTSLTLIGKNVSNFGKIQNENLLHILENFAGPEPANVIAGQLWYDSANYSLKFYNNGAWARLAVVDVTDTAHKPASGRPGYLWLNQDTNQLWVNTGTDYSLLGPELVPGYGPTKLSSVKVMDVYGGGHAVIKVIVNSEVVAIISADSTFDLASPHDPGFGRIHRGITFSDQSFILNGRSIFSNTATNAYNLVNGTAGALPYQSAVGTTQFLSIGTNTSILYSDGTGPSWQRLSTITAGFSNIASNLSSGSEGTLPYQTAPGVTTMLPKGNEGYVLVQGASAPRWKAPEQLSFASATTSTNTSFLLNNAGTAYVAASTATVAGTIVERTSNGSIRASTFIGSLIGTNITATSIVSLGGSVTTPIITKNGTDNSGDIGQSDNKFHAVYGNIFTGLANTATYAFSAGTAVTATYASVITDLTSNGAGRRYVSTQAPIQTDGNDGDIWYQV